MKEAITEWQMVSPEVIRIASGCTKTPTFATSQLNFLKISRTNREPLQQDVRIRNGETRPCQLDGDRVFDYITSLKSVEINDQEFHSK